jgi:tetratricopeptide (TPR) repeat protein
MKSERRHELATNELADWIANFPQWFNENLTTIIIGAVVVAGLIAYTIFYYHRESRVWDRKDAQIAAMLDQLSWQKRTIVEGKKEGQEVSDVFLNMASGYQSAADETENPILSAIAMMKRAEALRAELHYRSKIAEPDVRKFQLQQAQKIYEQALEKAKDDPTASAMAEYGIALCLEDMGDFSGAKNLYDKIAQADEYKGTLYQARAKLRASMLSDNQETVKFIKSETPPQAAEPNVKQSASPLKLEEPLVNIEGAVGEKSDSNSVK